MEGLHTMFLIRFLGSAVIAGVLTVGASFYWPRLTGQPRPQALQSVYDYVLGTKTGQEAAESLGAMDETPINTSTIQEAGSQVATGVVTVVTEKVQTIVIEKVVEELVKRYDILPPVEQEKVKEQICQ